MVDDGPFGSVATTNWSYQQIHRWPHGFQPRRVNLGGCQAAPFLQKPLDMAKAHEMSWWRNLGRASLVMICDPLKSVVIRLEWMAHDGSITLVNQWIGWWFWICFIFNIRGWLILVVAWQFLLTSLAFDSTSQGRRRFVTEKRDSWLIDMRAHVCAQLGAPTGSDYYIYKHYKLITIIIILIIIIIINNYSCTSIDS